ncbi:MAG: lysylphosphatidylglycerol synthase transmembrane domain-containing protein [Planctomycetota bacterium]
MTPATKTWLMRFIKLVVCCCALWYLSGKVSLNNYVRLRDAPEVRHLLVVEDQESVTIRDADDGQEHDVPRDQLAEPGQLERGQRSIEYGLRYIVVRIEWSWALWAFLAVAPAAFVMAWRLRILLKTQNIFVSFRDATLLTFAGNFFNFALPGTTGGDFYKAYHIAKQTHKRTEGVTIVFLDRVIGLISFLLLAAGAVFASWHTDIIGPYGRWVGYLTGVLIIGSCVFFSNRLRRWIRYERLLEKLPFGDLLRRVDETAFSFRYHPKATILALAGTILLHFVVSLSLYCLARGLGVEPSAGRTWADLYLACLLCFVVGYLFAAIPISVQGFGLLEAVFYKILVDGEWTTASVMLALSLGIRIIQIIWALPGVAVPWFGFKRPTKGLAERDISIAEGAKMDEHGAGG